MTSTAISLTFGLLHFKLEIASGQNGGKMGTLTLLNVPLHGGLPALRADLHLTLRVQRILAVLPFLDGLLPVW